MSFDLDHFLAVIFDFNLWSHFPWLYLHYQQKIRIEIIFIPQWNVHMELTIHSSCYFKSWKLSDLFRANVVGLTSSVELSELEQVMMIMGIAQTQRRPDY